MFTDFGIKTPDALFCSPNEGGGWKFQKSCYHVVKAKTTWDEAEKHCVRNFGGHLVTVLDMTVDIALNHMLSSLIDKVWIGIKIKVSSNTSVLLNSNCIYEVCPIEKETSNACQEMLITIFV